MQVSRNGSTALTVAADCGATSVLDALIKEVPGYIEESKLKDANASLPDGTTLLMLACRYGHMDTCVEQIEFQPPPSTLCFRPFAFAPS